MKRRRISRSILYITLLLLIIFSVIACVASIHQARPCFAMPLSYIFIINETLAVLAALAFMLVACCIRTILTSKSK